MKLIFLMFGVLLILTTIQAQYDSPDNSNETIEKIIINEEDTTKLTNIMFLIIIPLAIVGVIILVVLIDTLIKK